MEHIYWVGIKESEIRSCKHLFEGSVTFIGSGTEGNISFSSSNDYIINYNEDSEQLDNFMKKTLHRIIEEIPNVSFFCYTTSYIYSLEDPEINKHIICGNNRDTLQILRNKMNCRLWLNRYVPVLPTIILTGGECKYSQLCSLFPNNSAFTIQGCTGAGGVDTYVMCLDNHNAVEQKLYKNHLYLISPYKAESYSVNLHVIFDDNGYYISPGSIQVVELQEERLIYRGADFIEYQNINMKITEQIVENTKVIAEKLRLLPYKGILGIDYLIADSTTYFLEINPRFQSSTPMLNLALKENNLPSIQELIFNIFCKDFVLSKNIFDNLKVDYCSYIVDFESEQYDYKSYLQNITYSTEIEEVNLDGYKLETNCQKGASIFCITTKKNIVSLNPNGSFNICDNIKPYPNKRISLYEKEDCKWLKFALMNQGIHFSDEAQQQIVCFQEGVYSSLDIYITDKFIVNAPTHIPFHSLSPFKIDYNADGLVLYYGEQLISKIHICKKKKYCSQNTKKGISFQRISFIATDRLRIHHAPNCLFQTQRKGCRFCDVPGDSSPFDESDIKEVIDWHIQNDDFRHILIGGASGNYPYEYVMISNIVKHIKKQSDKSIYIMTLPPIDPSVLIHYYELGVDEIAFNIEVFNRKYARNCMPGKGEIPLETYQNALLYAVQLWGKTGKVRSILIYGLEDDTSFFKGIEWLASNGIQPIISPFRALGETVYANTIPPTTEKLIQIFDKASTICKKYNLELGPSCIYCQNNTLSFDSCIVLDSDN